MALIRERLVIGVKVGKVPAGMGASPLQQDLERSVKSARLTRSTALQKTDQTPGSADAGQLSRVFATPARLLGVPWGEPGSIRGDSLGSFRRSVEA
ncbi:MAG: hypothetical protein IPI11_13560 [Haliscomenobacter sp.]|nr:hypothetical protein [Haliscomenobacter sp.]